MLHWTNWHLAPRKINCHGDKLMFYHMRENIEKIVKNFYIHCFIIKLRFVIITASIKLPGRFFVILRKFQNNFKFCIFISWQTLSRLFIACLNWIFPIFNSMLLRPPWDEKQTILMKIIIKDSKKMSSLSSIMPTMVTILNIFSFLERPLLLLNIFLNDMPKTYSKHFVNSGFA